MQQRSQARINRLGLGFSYGVGSDYCEGLGSRREANCAKTL